MHTNPTPSKNHQGFFFDLVIYILVMFLVRKIYFPEIPFIANALLISLITLIVAHWRMTVRGITWKNIGLRKPQNILKTILVAGGILAAAVGSILVFEIIKDITGLDFQPDTSNETAAWRFGDLNGNWPLFFTIIFFVWVESFLEEILDRGFLLNWFEQLFSMTSFKTAIAVVLQAVIFGFRHSYDFSERSITVGLIGLVMGIAYVTFGRNLWPLILAHCILNSISMIERVL